jgi:hypothetical protein
MGAAGRWTAGLAVLLAAVAACADSPKSPAAASLAPLEGAWTLALEPAQRRQLRVMRFVLREPPPTDEELLQAGFRDDEARTAVTLLREVRSAPQGERVAQLRAMVAAMEDSAMVIQDGRLRMQVGPVTREGRLELVEVHGRRYQLRTIDAAGVAEPLTVATTDSGLVVGEGSEAMHFVRR